MRSFRVGSDATASLEPSKSAVVPSPERQHERRAMTIRAWTAVVLDDFRALTRGVLEHALEVIESGFRDLSTMKEKLLLWSNEVTRCELTQKLVVDVALHGPPPPWCCARADPMPPTQQMIEHSDDGVMGTRKRGSVQSSAAACSVRLFMKCGEAWRDEVIGQLRHYVQTGYIVCDAGSSYIPASDSCSVQTWR